MPRPRRESRSWTSIRWHTLPVGLSHLIGSRVDIQPPREPTGRVLDGGGFSIEKQALCPRRASGRRDRARADFPDPFGTTRLAGASDDPEVRRGIGEDIGDSVAADRLIDEPGASDALVPEDAPSGLEPEVRSTE